MQSHFLYNLQKGRHKGFSILEIMIALFLIAMILTAIPLGSQSHRRSLETAVDDIDRAIRFASNEAVLRNTVTRLNIKINSIPIEYSVEAGTTDDILLPNFENEKLVKSLAEEKEAQEKLKKLSQSFSKVSEFEEEKRVLREDVTILGVYTTYREEAIKDQQASLYFYPSGERDGALIVFATDDEVAALDIQSFTQKTSAIFQPFDFAEFDNIEKIQRNIMKEIHLEWLNK